MELLAALAPLSEFPSQYRHKSDCVCVVNSIFAPLQILPLFFPYKPKVFLGSIPQTAIEGVNLGIAGANYGWPTCEATCGPEFTLPIYSYKHVAAGGALCDASITGGFVYRRIFESS